MTNKLKVGDKVRVVVNNYGQLNQIGKIIKIIKIDMEDKQVPYSVEFKNHADMWYSDEDLQLITPKKKVGKYMYSRKKISKDIRKFLTKEAADILDEYLLTKVLPKTLNAIKYLEEKGYSITKKK